MVSSSLAGLVIIAPADKPEVKKLVAAPAASPPSLRKGIAFTFSAQPVQGASVLMPVAAPVAVPAFASAPVVVPALQHFAPVVSILEHTSSMAAVGFFLYWPGQLTPCEQYMAAGMVRKWDSGRNSRSTAGLSTISRWRWIGSSATSALVAHFAVAVMTIASMCWPYAAGRQH
jgi:hypothetical protein